MVYPCHRACVRTSNQADAILQGGSKNFYRPPYNDPSNLVIK